MTTTTATRALRLAVRDVSHTVRQISIRCSSAIAARRPAPRTGLDRGDPRPSPLDRLLSEADRSSSSVYHRTLVRRI
jgi:hypothetical protein